MDVQRDKNDDVGYIILPLVNKTEENVVFPLVLNVISRFWGEEIPNSEIEKRSIDYKNQKGTVFIEGLEIIEKNLNLTSIVYRGSLSDLKKGSVRGFLSLLFYQELVIPFNLQLLYAVMMKMKIGL